MFEQLKNRIYAVESVMAELKSDYSYPALQQTAKIGEDISDFEEYRRDAILRARVELELIDEIEEFCKKWVKASHI